MHYTSENHLIELPLKHLTVEGDGTLQALLHDVVSEGVNHNGFGSPFIPNIMKIYSLAPSKMKFKVDPRLPTSPLSAKSLSLRTWCSREA